MHGDVPVGWSVAKVDSIAEVVGGTTPSRARKEFFGGDIPWVTPTDITGLRGRFLERASETITDRGFRAAGLRLLPPGTVLLTSRATIGASAIAAVAVTTNQGFQSLIPRDGTVSLWLYYAIGHKKPELDVLAAGSTFREFSRQSLRELRLLVPPHEEQVCIATALDAIDEAIEKTEAVIAATEELRKALLQDLLTRGVPGWHSEWTTVPGIGTIPACWDVARLGDVLLSSQYGTSQPLCDEQGGVAVLRMGNLQGGEIEWESLKWAHLSDSELRDLLLVEGDILFNRTNSIDLVGKVSLVRHLPFSASFASYLVRLTTDRSVGDPYWLNAYMNTPDTQDRIRRMATKGASQANINPTNLQTLAVARPPVREQALVAEALRDIDDRRQAEKSWLNELRRAKSVVAEALLSGRVRVPPTLGVK